MNGNWYYHFTIFYQQNIKDQKCSIRKRKVHGIENTHNRDYNDANSHFLFVASQTSREATHIPHQDFKCKQCMKYVLKLQLNAIRAMINHISCTKEAIQLKVWGENERPITLWYPVQKGTINKSFFVYLNTAIVDSYLGHIKRTCRQYNDKTKNQSNQHGV